MGSPAAHGQLMPKAAYLAARGFEKHLDAELQGIRRVVAERLFITDRSPQPTRWAQNTWLDCHQTQISSIGDAARQLRSIQRSWAPFSHTHHRRMSLIQSKLPKVHQ